MSAIYLRHVQWKTAVKDELEVIGCQDRDGAEIELGAAR